MIGRVIQGRFIAGHRRATVPHQHVAQRSRLSGGSFTVDGADLSTIGPGRPLPDTVKAHMAEVLGADFSDVRVHVGPQAERIGAVAFTSGSDIFFAPGRFDPNTTAGRQLLAHELAHVVQQRQGRVRGQGGQVTIVQDQALEAEAERLGHKAAALPVHRPVRVQRKPGPPVAARPATLRPRNAATIQRLIHKRTSPGGIAFYTDLDPTKEFNSEEKALLYERKLASGLTIAEDAAPFVLEDARSSIAETNITEGTRGASGAGLVYAYQCTKFRNLAGIRAAGLDPAFGGKKIGFSHNPIQKDSLREKSIKGSTGKVTVGTGSRVISAYALKARAWCEEMRRHLRCLSTSSVGLQLWTARTQLLGMQWVDDPRLGELLNCRFEELFASTNSIVAAKVRTLRHVFSGLCDLVSLNEPVIIRFPARASDVWTVDPDDPQGYQTTNMIDPGVIEALIDHKWVGLHQPAAEMVIKRMYGDIFREDDLLSPQKIHALLEDIANRDRIGLMGTSGTRHETPEETVAMMGP